MVNQDRTLTERGQKYVDAELAKRAKQDAKAKAKADALQWAKDHPVTKALAPFRAEAIKRNVDAVREQIDKAIEKLQDADGQLNEVAPKVEWKPSMSYMGESGYRFATAKRAYYYRIAKCVDGRDRMEADEEGIQRELSEAARAAAANYDDYSHKLANKVGEAVSATVEGNLWSHSICTVTKVDGTVERWKTQCILNQSCLGKVFNQWPTRKMK
jgi:phage terminase Nu1 subunit (DNA packaging protein)